MFAENEKVLNFIRSHEGHVLRHFQDLKALINLKWVAFERIYNDGYTCVLSSNASVYEFYFERLEIFVHSPNKEDIKNNIYKNISFLENSTVSRISNEMMSFDCESHFLLINYHKEYQDVFRFSIKNASKTINHLQLIEHLSFKFIARNRQLIESESAYFMLPKQMQSNLKDRYFTPYIILWDNLQVHTQLTAREFFVLRLYIKGKPHKQIGEILGVEASTSERYLENIKIKLQIHSRKELKALACDNWLI